MKRIGSKSIHEVLFVASVYVMSLLDGETFEGKIEISYSIQLRDYRAPGNVVEIIIEKQGLNAFINLV